MVYSFLKNNFIVNDWPSEGGGMTWYCLFKSNQLLAYQQLSLKSCNYLVMSDIKYQTQCKKVNEELTIMSSGWSIVRCLRTYTGISTAPSTFKILDGFNFVLDTLYDLISPNITHVKTQHYTASTRYWMI